MLSMYWAEKHVNIGLYHNQVHYIYVGKVYAYALSQPERKEKQNVSRSRGEKEEKRERKNIKYANGKMGENGIYGR